MKRYSFPLRRVLDWKSVVTQQEQTTLATLEQRHSTIQSSLLSLDESIKGLCQDSQAAVSGHELACSAHARAAVQRKKRAAQQDHAACLTLIEGQRQRLRAAETERRLLDKLQDRSRSEWAAEFVRETDSQASDLHLGAWTRR